MIIGSSLDLRKEIASKKEYSPDSDTLRYIEAQVTEFTFDQTQFLKQYKIFNDRNFIEYMTLAEEDTFKYVPAPVDPNDWRNFIRSGGERAGLDSLLAFTKDLNFQCEPEARDFLGNVSETMGKAGGAFLKYINILDETDVKDPLTDLAMFAHGTVFKQVKFNTIQGIKKIAEEWNPTKGNGYSYTTRRFDRFVGIESTIMKPNRVFLSDIKQVNPRKQEHIWYEAIIPYGNAYTLFGSWENWKFVKPYAPPSDEWTDTDTDVELEDKGIADKVRVRVRESLLTNELSIYCNKVLMTPIGLRLPEDEYSILYQAAAPLYPTGFAYGRSFMDNIRPYISVKDVLTSVLVDTSRQIPEPPMKSRFRTMINRYMFKPAAVTQMQGDGDLTPLIPQGAMQNFVFEAIKVYEQMAKDASPSPLLQQQQGGAEKTRRQIELEMQQAIRAIANQVAACEEWRRQESRLKLNFGVNHFAKISGFKFEVGGEGVESKLVEMKKIPSRQKAFLAAVTKMSEAENLARAQGKKTKMYQIDPEKLPDYNFVINFRVNPHVRDSESADIQDVKEKVEIYRQDPSLDQKEVSKIAIKAFGDDAESLIMKQQQSPQPQPGNPAQPIQQPPNGQPQQSQMPQPMPIQ